MRHFSRCLHSRYYAPHAIVFNAYVCKVCHLHDGWYALYAHVPTEPISHLIAADLTAVRRWRHMPKLDDVILIRTLSDISIWRFTNSILYIIQRNSKGPFSDR